MKPNKKLVGKRIQAIRLNMKYTLEEFGGLFNATKSNACCWEKGNSLPNKKRLNKIAQLGKLTVNELLYGNNEYDIEDLEQRLMEIPIEERVELILRVFKETSKNIKEKSSC
jgi:putative DNA-binding phage protein